MRFIFFALAAFVLSLSTAQPTGAHAEIPRPRNFVAVIECPAQSSATVTFPIPGSRDLLPTFGALPTQIWIDLSLFDNGFAQGTFIGAGPFFVQGEFAGTVFRWRDVFPAAEHHYRPNGLFGNRWVEIGRSNFETPNCNFVTGFACTYDSTSIVSFLLGAAVLTSDRPVLQQWIDLTLFSNPDSQVLDNGFLPGTFIGAGPFPPAGAHFAWRGLVPARRHYYRVNLLHGGPRLIGAVDQWEPYFTGSFLSPDGRDVPQFRPPDS
jgi:hypothetical protein